MLEALVPNHNVNDAIAAEAPGHVLTAGTELWLGRYGALDCLQICSLSTSQANGWITGQGFDEIISFTEIRT